MLLRHTATRRRSVVRRHRLWRPLLLGCLLLAGAYAFMGGEAGVRQLWERWHALQQAEQRAAELEAQTDSLCQVLWLLENDLDYVEKVAREEYGMARPTERVYRLPPEADQ